MWAEQTASFYLSKVKPNDMPPWDFSAPAPAFVDTSAAAIAASAFVALSNYTAKPIYRSRAESIVATLQSRTYAPTLAESESVTWGNAHDCGNFPHCSIIEPEFYLLEAIRRLQGHKH